MDKQENQIKHFMANGLAARKAVDKVLNAQQPCEACGGSGVVGTGVGEDGRDFDMRSPEIVEPCPDCQKGELTNLIKRKACEAKFHKANFDFRWNEESKCQELRGTWAYDIWDTGFYAGIELVENQAAARIEGLEKALEEIRDLETECCPRCEGNGRLYADGKAHFMSENAPTIFCGNCGGSGRILPDNAQEIAKAALGDKENES